MASAPITSWQIHGEKVEQRQILLSRATKSMPIMTVAMKLKDDCSLEGIESESRSLMSDSL